ncbi:thioredoxin family protein [Streptomyces sp. WM6372]|uniref:thioredoxin family protein n=1 Tax=Streptomyces sp. WM6372 TaxID=1415555 RepID=UPI0006AF8A64|nr:thioredoxin family protein [Streptomyces sp. WM6372]
MLRPVRSDLRTQPPGPGTPRGMRLPLVAAAVVAAGLTAACGPSTQPAGSAAPSTTSATPELSAASAAESATASPSASPTASASASVSASATPRPGSSPAKAGSAAATGTSAKPSRTSAAAQPAAVPGSGYDSSADAQKLIDAALRTAKSEGRMVLLDFGANWCGNCKAADKVFAQSQTAAILGNSYRMVKIDIGGNSSANSALLRKYSPSGGTYTMPVLVVVSPSGTVRTDTHVTGNPSLTPEGINSFLRQWAS